MDAHVQIYECCLYTGKRIMILFMTKLQGLFILVRREDTPELAVPTEELNAVLVLSKHWKD